MILRERLTKTFQTLIKEMNRLGMIVDLSHSSVQVTSCQKKNLPPFDKKSPPFSQTARDTLEISVAPVIFSHSSAQALCNSARNVPDQLLKLTVLSSPCHSLMSTFCPQAAKKGLVMINFFSYFITCSNVSSLNDVIGRQATILWNEKWTFLLSTYQPREGGGWHRLCGHRGQLRRHQCVSLGEAGEASNHVCIGCQRGWRTCPSTPTSSPSSMAQETGLFSTSKSLQGSTSSESGRMLNRWKRISEIVFNSTCSWEWVT